jgi:hypothetical protein
MLHVYTSYTKSLYNSLDSKKSKNHSHELIYLIWLDFYYYIIDIITLYILLNLQ